MQVPDVPEPIRAWRAFRVVRREGASAYSVEGFHAVPWASRVHRAQCSPHADGERPWCPGKSDGNLRTCYVHLTPREDSCEQCREARDPHFRHGIYAVSEPKYLIPSMLCAEVLLWGWVWPHSSGTEYRAEWCRIEAFHPGRSAANDRTNVLQKIADTFGAPLVRGELYSQGR